MLRRLNSKERGEHNVAVEILNILPFLLMVPLEQLSRDYYFVVFLLLMQFHLSVFQIKFTTGTKGRGYGRRGGAADEQFDRGNALAAARS